MFRLLMLIVVVIFVLITVFSSGVKFFSRDFAPNLDTTYSANILPRIGASLVAGGTHAAAVIVAGAILGARFIGNTIAAILQGVDRLMHPGPASPLPAPAPAHTPPPPAPLPLPAPAASPPPPTVPVPAGAGFFTTIFASYLTGFALVLSAKTILYFGGWYIEAYKVQWPGGPNSLSLPVLAYRDNSAKGGFLVLQLFCFIAGIVFLFGGGLAGYAGGILGFVSGAALPIVPRAIFLGLRLVNVHPDRVLLRLKPLNTEERAIIRLSVRNDGTIVSATFIRSHRGIPAGTALSDLQLIDLARFANALRMLDGLPHDADFVERYLGQIAPDWREQAEAAEAAEEEEAARRSQPQGMTRKQALEILALQEGATRADIQAAYRRLMLPNHPDRGGSPFIAKQLNEARDVLLD